jgi:predicted phage terminase large subunit-like protein
MASPFYRRLFPNTCLSSEKQSVDDFMTTTKGFRMSTSVGGVLTGREADLIILDDPLKPDEAFFEIRRNGVNEWYDHTLLSRLNNKGTGTIIIVMQRLHQDDLVGHVIEHEKWEVLSFPAIAEEDELHVIDSPLGGGNGNETRAKLYSRNVSRWWCSRISVKTIGAYNFASQYQQSPTPVGGAIILTQWIRRYDENDSKEFVYILQSWDTANKSGEINDYSVCTTWGMLHEKYYLLDVFRKRLDYPQLKRAIKEQAEKHKAHTIILVEDKASGTQLIQDLKNDGVCGIEGYEAPTGTDKTMRPYAQAAEFEAGHVLLSSSASWREDYTRAHELSRQQV